MQLETQNATRNARCNSRSKMQLEMQDATRNARRNSGLVFLLNRTEPNFWSGSGSVHQISVRVRVRFIKSRFRFGSVHWRKGLVRVRFGSSNLSSGSGSVRFNHVMLYFISKKKKCYYSICKKIVFRCH